MTEKVRVQIPEGWKLVPVEPTRDMVRAGNKQREIPGNGGMQHCYKAMLAAAPTLVAVKYLELVQ